MPLTATPLDDHAYAILEARHHDPFSYLGPHKTRDGSVTVRAMLPNAHSMHVVLKGGEEVEADLLHPNGLFSATPPATAWGQSYELRWRTHEGKTVQHADPYSFGLCLGELDMHLFCEGRHWRIFDHLGAHPKTIGGVDGTLFAVWAPNAKRVSVIADFNSWDGRAHPMR